MPHHFSNTKIKPLAESYRGTTAQGISTIVTPLEINEMVSIFVRIKTGSLFEGPYLGSGISHLLEHSVFLGSKKYPEKDSFAKYIEQLGGIDLNAYTTYDHTSYFFSVFSYNLDQALSALSDFLFAPLLDKTEIANEMGTIVSEMNMVNDRASYAFYNFVSEKLFKNLPYKYPIIGLPERFEKLNPTDLQRYYSNTYLPENMILSISGKLEVDAAVASIEKCFCPHPVEKQERSTTFAQPKEAWKENVSTGKIGETTHAKIVFPKVSLVYPTTHLEDSRNVSLDLISFFLTSGKGSLLYDLLKEEKRFVESISAYSFTPKAFAPLLVEGEPERGYFSISFELNGNFKDRPSLKKHIDKTNQEIQNVLQELADYNGKYQQELPDLLEAAKNTVSKDFLEEKESPMEVAASLTHSLHYYDHLQHEQHYLDAVRKTTPQDICKTAADFFTSLESKSNLFLIVPQTVFDQGEIYRDAVRSHTLASEKTVARGFVL